MIPTKEAVTKSAHVKNMEEYKKLYQESLLKPDFFWQKQADRLHWFAPPSQIHRGDAFNADFSWFEGGKLNASYNCVDRHAAKNPDKTALIWAADGAGTYRHISYGELLREVCRVANVLLTQGVKSGDRVCIYMPMIPELAYTILACARIGAIHSVVFGGFSAEALRDRILDARCKIVVTANVGLRGGKIIPLKKTVDEALLGIDCVERVLVARRTADEVIMQADRDLFLDDEMNKERGVCAPAWMDAEAPLFILYTSGSTGKPKGVLHTTAGYLLQTSLSHEWVFDLREDDIYCCAADVGWVTGHSYILYGPLCNGATTMMFESTPLYPDAGRYWRMVEDLGITVFYTAPTALRAIAQAGDEFVRKYKRDSLRVLGSVGEPINPEIWRWYHEVVGEKRCAVVDTWWQTETGAILISPLPGVTPTKPGSATLPLFGIEPVLVDDQGNVLEGNNVAGNLCLKGSWPAQARTLYGDHSRFIQTYFAAFKGLYFTGDGARRDEDGYYWITGRVDDVLNVSGHRLGTAEIESALVAHESVAEAAVVGIPHAIKGTGIYAFVHLAAGQRERPHEELATLLREHVRHVIGAFAAPDAVQITSGLPKTRSGKIMRRILRKIAGGDYKDLGDLSTLADPSVVDALIKARIKN